MTFINFLHYFPDKLLVWEVCWYVSFAFSSRFGQEMFILFCQLLDAKTNKTHYHSK